MRIVKGMGATAMAMATMVPAMPVSAQTAVPASTGLEEIVVTAQKRSENLQDVPISVVAFTPSALETQRIESTQDLQLTVPALEYSHLSTFALPYLRGIGTQVALPGADASVATYVDGVYQASEMGVIQNLLGIQRVEVLEGPQGTLYGRNAVGGAINIYTLTPTHDLDAGLAGTGGNFSRAEVSGHISGGVTDTLAIGLYVAGSTRDSYLTAQHLVSPAVASYEDTQISTYEPKQETNSGARLKAVWTPTDDFTLTGSSDYMISRSFEGGAWRNIQPAAAGYLFYPPGTPIVIQPYVIQSDQAQYNNVTQGGTSFREELNLGWSNLLGISAYHKTRASVADDIDGTFAPLVASAGPNNGITSEELSQELQLLSPTGSPFNWIGGVYVFSQLAQFRPNYTQSLIIFQPSPVFTLNNFAKVRTDSYAAFAQVTVPLDAITQGMHFTLGGRETIDKKYLSDSYQNDTDINGNLIPGSTTSYPDGSHTWRNFSPKLTLDYRRGGTLFYATYSEGYKAGVYNIAAPSLVGPVNPENLSDIEIGTKSEFADGRVRLNNSAYYYDYRNLQVERAELTATGSAVTLQNAAAARMYGLESSLTLKASENLTLDAALAAEHAVFASFPNAEGYLINAGPTPGFNTATILDATGNQTPNSPKFVGTLGAEYNYPLPNGGHLDLTGKAYLNGGFDWDSANQLRQKSYHLLNATLAYVFPGDHLTVRAWGTNLTNSYYGYNEEAFAFSVIALDAPPRMYGMTIDWKY